MNRTILVTVFAATLSGATVQAQAPVYSPVATPSSPAPTVVNIQQAAPSVVQAPLGVASSDAAVTQTVYTPQLPSAADLTNAAAAQGFTVERIVQTSNQVIAFYRDANGQATTVAYQSLPPTGNVVAPAPAQVTVAQLPRVVVTAPPPVVYEAAPSVVYYERYPTYYYPRTYYPPVSLNLGFGYRSYHGGHIYHRGHSPGGRHRR